MMSKMQVSAEMQEERERWLMVFQQKYDETIKMEDLCNLDNNFVLSIYLHFIKRTLNASLDNMKLISFNCPEHMKMFPEAYDNAIVMPKIARLLSWFFHSFFNDDSFTFGDLVKPKPARTRIFFNFIIDFMYRFRDAQEKFDVMRQQVDDKVKRREAMMAEIATMKDRVEMQKQRRGEQRIQEEEERKLRQSQTEELESKQLAKAAIKADLEKMKAAVAKTTDDARSNKMTNVMLQEEVDRLRGSVVQQEELAALQRRVDEEQLLKTSNEEKKKELGDMEASLQTDKDMIRIFDEETLPITEEISQLAAANTTAEQSTARLLGQTEQAMSECDDLDHQESVRAQHLSAVAEAGNKHRVVAAKKKEGIVAEVHISRDMLEKIKKADQDHGQQSKEITKEIEDCVQRLDGMEVEQHNLRKFFNEHYRLTTAEVEIHNLATQDSLQKLNEVGNIA